MHLKTLTLRGFKSFASATTLSFEPGINCVVGPNGSGKSNVVDALAWVMGEQGAKNLRGGNMADVIFAGTSKRPALGRAEVSLTIDNADGALPIEFSEVTISRTLFRSGGSEYAINGTAARLLDIQELLSDTGMGKEMHVIIGQGKLDEVLSATPEDRRNFIEEAAGVLKHRRRKEKALRKLDAMKANLTRIEDLASELRRQLGPLARQAATARRAQIIQAEVFDARARLLADDLAQATARLEAQTGDEKKIAAQRAELTEKVTEAAAQVQQIEAEAAKASPEIATLTESWQRLSSLVERFRGLAQLAAERQRTLSEPSQAAYRGESVASILERASRAREQEQDLRSQVAAAQDALNDAVAAREQAEAAENEIDSRLATVNRAIADRREESARLNGRIQAANSRVEALRAENERVAAAMRAARERAEQAEAQVRELEEQAVAHSDGDDSLSIAHEEAARRSQEAADAVEQARKALTEAQSDHVKWRTTAETLALSLQAQDATRWLLEEHRSGVRGLVRDLVRVSPGWEVALEAASFGIAGGAVVGDVDAAVDALRAARETQAGHLELLIETDEQAEERAREALEAAGLPADQAMLASDAVLADGGPARALRQVVSGTVLAVDLAAAKRLLAAGAPAVATQAGDFISSSHARGGENQEGAVLARQAAYDSARRQEGEAEVAVERASKALEQAIARSEVAANELAQLGAQLSARDSQLAAVTAQLGILRQSVTSAREEVERNESRSARIAVELEARGQELEQLRAQSADLGEGPQDLEANSKELTAEREAAHKRTIATRSDETEARLKLRTREERSRSGAGKADSLVAQARAVEARIAAEERGAQRRLEAAQAAQSVHEDALAALAYVQELAGVVTEKRAAAQAENQVRDAELTRARTSLEELRGQLRQLEEAGHRQELAVAEQRLRFEQLEARALEDLGMSGKALVDEYGPHLPVESEAGTGPFVRAEQEKRLRKAERDLARLGKINPLALEEHAALEERQRYLASQLEDLRKTRSDLLGIVRDIDERVEQVMTAALADVAEQFTQTFARLFPGGSGRIVLTDPESVLTTGVEIEARPPGKRVKRLSLLSGGERSLTAIAFLVAIFKARPSPFYVMDEVEAALDDTNLSRLLELFQELRSNSQLLIITHQKRTMEIADALYGVAMRGDGVTSVISQRLKEIDE